MGTNQKKFSLEGLAEKAINIGIVLLLLYTVFGANLTKEGSLFKTLQANLFPQDAQSGTALAAPKRVQVASEAPTASRILAYTGVEEQAPVREARPAAAPVAEATAQPVRKQDWVKRLNVDNAAGHIGYKYSADRPTQQTSAGVTNAPAYQAPQAAQTYDYAGYAAQAGAAAQDLVANEKQYTSYSRARRSDMMGRSAGPVYNLKGGGGRASGSQGALIQQVGPSAQ